jgi:hypothetical protein
MADPQAAQGNAIEAEANDLDETDSALGDGTASSTTSLGLTIYRHRQELVYSCRLVRILQRVVVIAACSKSSTFLDETLKTRLRSSSSDVLGKSFANPFQEWENLSCLQRG